jgi:hypothetical protein
VSFLIGYTASLPSAQHLLSIFSSSCFVKTVYNYGVRTQKSKRQEKPTKKCQLQQKINEWREEFKMQDSSHLESLL